MGVVEDGALGHKGHAKKYRELNGMDVLPWPAQSPDLNFIEALWQDVEVELGQIWGRVSDLGTLEAAVKAAWNTITEERLEAYLPGCRLRLMLMDLQWLLQWWKSIK